jgi:hypothetical protein
MTLNCDQTRYFLWPYHLVRHQNIADARRGHDLRFAQLATSHADRPRTHQLMRDRRNLDPFDMGPPRHAQARQLFCYTLNIAF